MPAEAYPKLDIHSDGVETVSITRQCFDAFAGWAAKILNTLGGVQHA